MRLERQFSAAPMDPGSRALSTEYAKVIRRIIVSEKFVIGWGL